MSDSPRINYVSQAAGNVTVEYFNMPSGARFVLVNVTSGEKTGSPANAAGSGTISMATTAPSGQYYVQADSSSGEELAQTVPFYIGG
jgi:hypothetical protein